MSIEIKVPAMGESVTEATVARWFKKEGESVARDEPLAGTGNRQGDGGSARARRRRDRIHFGQGRRHGAGGRGSGRHRRRQGRQRRRRAASRAEAAAPKPKRPKPQRQPSPPPPRPKTEAPAMPSAQRIAEETGISTAVRRRHRPDGRVTKGDMLGALEARAAKPAPAASPRRPARAPNADARGTRADDAAAQDHRAAPEGIAEHRRPAHHLQRSGHEPRHGAAQPPTRTASRRSMACAWASWASSPRPASRR